MVGGLVWFWACSMVGQGEGQYELVTGTLDYEDQLYEVDDPFDGVTGGKNNDNEDENSSNMDVSSFMFRGILQGELVPDCLVEEGVEDDYEKEGDEAQED